MKQLEALIHYNPFWIATEEKMQKIVLKDFGIACKDYSILNLLWVYERQHGFSHRSENFREIKEFEFYLK